MQIPIVNKLTGTDPDDLLKDYLRAKHALVVAVEAMTAVYPHGRDYQGGSINEAMNEHAARILKVRQVIAEIDTIAESLV